MKISAKVLEASCNQYTDTNLFTLELRYPRFIHAEFMTHRVFSRNASSSRAIPIGKQIDAVERNPVFPSEWGTNKPGMQAGDRLARSVQTDAENVWAKACIDAISAARKLKDLGVHKQLANRLLEPFAYITVIVSATEWSNFFDLRISELAQPEIRILAEQIKAEMEAIEPVVSKIGYVHAPYLSEKERATYEPDVLMMISAARCARVSYLNHDGMEPSVDKDLALAQRLFADRHASVFEHQAFPMSTFGYSRNLKDWHQHRAILGL